MNTILEQINSTGKAFVEFAVPMLAQSGVLIVILLLLDLALRKKVKAVFRYCIWMLVLVKLLLPTSLSSPLSLGYWFGDHLAYVAESRTSAAPEAEAVEPPLADMLHIIEPVPIEERGRAPVVLPMMPDVEPAVTELVSPPAVSVTPVTWQGVVFLLWLAVVLAMGLLLLQRAMFVRGLVAQAREANRLMNDALEYCCKCMGVKRKVGLKVSANATSPAVCGLFRPVILLPHKLAPTLGSRGLRAVLMHELAHIRRGDLWVNLVQTVLQIAYFYNPLLWLANAKIRRVREQAIDETVLVAMGDRAQQYPQTLVNVAKLAFKRPVLSLRLIGVVESKNALAGRIKHILNRPMPKTAKVGVVGVLAVIIAAAILLPMAKAEKQADIETSVQAGSLEHFVGKYAMARHPDTAVFEITKKGDVFIFSDLGGPKFEMALLLKGLEGRKFEMEKGRDNLKFGDDPRERFRVRYDALENRYILDELGMRGEVQDAVISPLTELVKISGENPADKTNVPDEGKSVGVVEEKVAESRNITRYRGFFKINEEMPVNLNCPVVKDVWGRDQRPIKVETVEFVKKDERLHCSVKIDGATAADGKFVVGVNIRGKESRDSAREVLLAVREFLFETICFSADRPLLIGEVKDLDLGSIHKFAMATSFEVVIEDITQRVVAAKQGVNVTTFRGAFKKAEPIPVKLDCPAVKDPWGNDRKPFKVETVEFAKKDDHLYCSVKIDGATAADGKFIVWVKIYDRESRDSASGQGFVDPKGFLFQTHCEITGLPELIREVQVLDFGPIFEDVTSFEVEIVNITRKAESAEESSESDVQVEVPWGQPVEGVQVRLRAEKDTWKADEVPTFRADVRNLGSRVLAFPVNPVHFAELEMDGIWYFFINRWREHASGEVFPPNKNFSDIGISLTAEWQTEMNGRSLELMLGKHTVRLAFNTESDGGTERNVRYVSNPVEIEVLPADSDVKVEGEGKSRELLVFESYFPGDDEAGKKLDEWWEKRKEMSLDDEDFFDLFRKGLRRSTVKYKGNFLMQHIGGGYIWHKEPDDQRAIDIVYHASFSPEYKYYSVYSGLSVANPKSEKVLKRLVEIAMEYHQLGRIIWGVKGSKQEEEFLALLAPYLNGPDDQKREHAQIVQKAFKGEIDAGKWEKEWNQIQQTEKTIREFGDELPKIKKTFLTGTSEERLKAINFIRRNAITLTFDQSFIRALDACSQDSDANVRAGAASFLGYNYIWGKDVEPKEVIEILLRLSKDEDRQVRYNTVYSGLAVVNEKDEKVIKRLVEMALADHENNLYGRIVWGMKGPVRTDSELVERILAEQIDSAKPDIYRAASVYFLFKQLFNAEPPLSWGLEEAAGNYPNDVFGVYFSPHESFQPENKETLWQEFNNNLPDGINVQRIPFPNLKKLVIWIKVKGEQDCDAVKKIIKDNPKLKLGQSIPLGPLMQLYFEELQETIAVRESENSDVQVEVEKAHDKAQIENIINQLWTAIEAKDAERVKKLAPSKEFIRKDFDINKWILKQAARRAQLIEKENHDISKMESVAIEGDKAAAVTRTQGEGIAYLFKKISNQWTLYEMIFGSLSPTGPAGIIYAWRQTELKREAWAEYLKAGELLHKGTDRAEMAKRFSSIGQRYPLARVSKICSELGILLTEMAAEDKEFVEPGDIESLSADERINYYIFKLRNVAEQEMFVPGKCRVLYYPKTPNSAAVALRGMGKTVIPAMIVLLDDRRPTRSVGLAKNNAVILRYCDVALEIIEAIAEQKFDKRTERGAFLSTAGSKTREEIISRVKVWWEQDKQKTVVPVEVVAVGEFEELSVKLGGIWIHWQDVEFTVRGDGSVRFSMNKGPNDKTRYKTAFKLSGKHLAELSGLLQKTNWLTAPGANVQPGFSDATRIDISLTREDKVQNVWCHDRNAEPYLALIIFLKRIQRQEYLLYQMTVPGSLDRHSAFNDVYQQIRAEKGEPVSAHPHRILDFSRFIRPSVELIGHPDENHYETVAIAAKILGKLKTEQVRPQITDLTTAERKEHRGTAAVIRTGYIRTAAVEALTELGGEQSRLHIRDMAKNHRSWRRQVNEALVEGLLELDSDNCVQLLKDMASTTKKASWGLIRLGPAGMPAIVEILEVRDTRYMGQIYLIRQYIDHWQEVTKPIDPRVIEAVQRNLDYRLGRGPGWTNYHKEFLQLAGAPELPSKDARQIAEEFLAAVKANDQMKIGAIARTGGGSWPQRLAKLKGLPGLQQLKVTEVYADKDGNIGMAVALDTSREKGARVSIYLNFLSGSVWRVVNIAVERPEIGDRMTRRFLESHPNAKPVTAKASSVPGVKKDVRRSGKSTESKGSNPTAKEPSEHIGRISGIVVSSVTSEPVSGAYVGVGDFGDSGGSNYSRHRSQGFYDKTKTDEQGRFELDGLVFTDDHPYLKHHPLVVTHPDFVRHDEKVELLKDKPVADVKVSLRPAARIDVAVVDAEGNPIDGHWLIRLETLDGRRFIPPGSDPHLSSFASSIWAHWPDLRTKMGISQGFTFTELDTGEYSIEAIRFHLVDNPTQQNMWKPTVTYHGSIPSLEIQAGQAKEVKLSPQNHQTHLTITPPEFPEMLLGKLKRSSRMPLMCLISRNPGLLLWDNAKIYHLEDQRLGRIDKKRFFRGFFPQGKPLTINNLPPGSYSLFAMAVYGEVAGCLIGARAELAKGDNVVVEIPWRQPQGPSMVGPNRAFDYPVKLEAGDYSVSELCEIVTDLTKANPRLIADSSIDNERLRFGEGKMSIWDLLEMLYLEKGWRVDEGEEKTLILRPGVKSDVEVEGTGQKEPKITFEKTTHDFGQISPKSTNSCEFKFTNTGDGLLKIGNIETCCGFTAKLKSNKKDYAPGESGTVIVTFNASRFRGSLTRHQYVNSNDKVRPRVRLTVKADIVPKVSYEPKKLELLLKEENAGCPEITLISLDNQPFAIQQFKSTANSITADFEPSVKKTKFVIQPKVDMEKLRRGLSGRISISLTHPQCRTVTIPFNTRPRFKISPASIIALRAEPLKPTKREIWILSNYNEDFEIESVSSQKGIVKVLSQEKIRSGYQFELEITPPAVEGKKRFFTDVFFVNIKGGEKLKISCRGFYAK